MQTLNEKNSKLLEEYARNRTTLAQIIKQGYNIQFHDDNGDNILHIACKINNLEDARTILNHQLININLPNKNGARPLHDACWRGNEKVIDLLLKHNAEPNPTNNEGETPWFKLSQTGNIFTPEYILKYNIDLNATNFRQTTLLASILNQKSLDTFLKIAADETLAKKIKWQQKDNKGNTLFHQFTSSYYNNSEETSLQVASILKQHKVDPNESNHNGDTPIKNLTHNHNLLITKTMHQLGANFNCIDYEKNTFASSIQNQIIEQEKEIAKETHSRDWRQEKLSTLKEIQTFLTNNQLNSLNTTEIEELLTRAVQDKNMPNVRNIYETYVAQHPQKQLLLDEVLIDCFSIYDPKIQISNYLMKQGANINSKQMNEKKGEQRAVFLSLVRNTYKESEKVIRHILKSGYDCSKITDPDTNSTALISFAEGRSTHYEIFKLLLTQKMDLNHQNNEGNTALHCIFKESSYNGISFSMAQSFIEAGGKVNIPNNNGETAYELYKNMDNPRTLEARQRIATIMENAYLSEKIDNTKETKKTLKI